MVLGTACKQQLPCACLHGDAQLSCRLAVQVLELYPSIVQQAEKHDAVLHTHSHNQLQAQLCDPASAVACFRG